MATRAAPIAVPPGRALNALIWSFGMSQAVFVTAKLGIADVLRAGPQPSAALAAATGAHEPTLRRLLRALTTIDLLVEDQEGRFAATATGELLRSDHPQSMRPFALMMGEPFVWRPWGDLHATVLDRHPRLRPALRRALLRLPWARAARGRRVRCGDVLPEPP